MTVTTNYTPKLALGDGVTTSILLTWYFELDSRVVVKLDGVLQTKGVDYNLTGAGVAAGPWSVDFVTAPVNGAQIEISRFTSRLSLTSLANVDDFDQEGIEGVLDHLIRIDQEQDVGETWRGAWALGIDYYVGDKVSHGGSSYITTVSHKSDGGTEPGVGVNWALFWGLTTSIGATGPTGPAGGVSDHTALTSIGTRTHLELESDIAGKEPANANIQAHISATGNPHSATPGDIGAEVAGVAATLVTAHEAAGDPHTSYLKDDGTRAMAGSFAPDTDQTRNLGGASTRFNEMRGRLGIFVGKSTGGGAVAAGSGTITTGLTAAGIIAGNQVQLSTGTAEHKLRTGAFKGVACIGNVYSAGTGNTILDNNSGGGSVFGSAFSYGAGNATVQALTFGNFTAVYSYCGGGASGDHTWINRSPGGFLAGYSQGAGTVAITNRGPGSFMNLRPTANVNRTTTCEITNAAQGGLMSGAPQATNTNINWHVRDRGGFIIGATANQDAESDGRGAGVMGFAGIGDGPMRALADNAVQLGPGVNSQTSSLAVGDITGGGIRIIAAGLPVTPADGDMWKVSGEVFVRTSGVTKSMNNI